MFRNYLERRRILGSLILLVLALASSPASSRSLRAGNGSPSASEPNPVLVELFTSEGCSSCPPADGMLQKLDELQPIPGAFLIVLSEHVTYWDHDGWKDPNSLQLLTDRQTDYENALREKTPYTPQIIVDGSQIIRIDQTQQQMDEIFHKATATPKLPVHIGEVDIDAGSPPMLRTHIETGENSDKQNADVYVALALEHVESQVLRGENGGKHLVHVAVVRQLTKIGKLEKGKTFSKDIQLKLPLGADPKNLRLVAFVQNTGTGKVVGAALHKPAN